MVQPISTPKKALRPSFLRAVVRLLVMFLFASLIGWTLNYSSRALEGSTATAGFGQGLLQGALMPCTMPTLLLGNDVAIYAEDNAGVIYKFGYTLGVNLCGALFFGFLFWRLRRWYGLLNRKGDAVRPPADAER